MKSDYRYIVYMYIYIGVLTVETKALLLSQVREMPLVQFTSDYGSDINAVLLESIKRASAAQACRQYISLLSSMDACLTRSGRSCCRTN